MVDPLVSTGVFMMGASAGALLTHIRHRTLLNRHEELLRAQGEKIQDPVCIRKRLAPCELTSESPFQSTFAAQRGQRLAE